jgi:hypothetical protein
LKNAGFETNVAFDFFKKRIDFPVANVYDELPCFSKPGGITHLQTPHGTR